MVLAICMSNTPVLSQEEGGVRGLKERVDELESIMKGIELSGVVEIEAGYSDYDFDDPAEEDESSSDLAVPTVELAVDAGITDQLKGYILFLYEDDESVTVDEAIIHFQADEDNHIEDFVASLTYALPEEMVEGYGLMAGVSLVSDIADSDGLSDFLAEAGADSVGEYVAGYSAFLSMSIMEKFTIELEYNDISDYE